MILLAGASASGKTEVAKLLAKKYHIEKVITTTTRPIRINEVDGKDYFFVDKEEFLKREKEGVFVETTKFNANYYGSSKDQIADDKCIVVDVNGLKKYLELNNSTIVSFFLDSSEKIRRERMIKRGDLADAIESRLKFDATAFDKNNIPNVDYHIESETSDIEEITDKIYQLYKEKRGL